MTKRRSLLRRSSSTLLKRTAKFVPVSYTVSHGYWRAIQSNVPFFETRSNYNLLRRNAARYRGPEDACHSYDHNSEQCFSGKVTRSRTLDSVDPWRVRSWKAPGPVPVLDWSATPCMSIIFALSVVISGCLHPKLHTVPKSIVALWINPTSHIDCLAAIEKLSLHKNNQSTRTMYGRAKAFLILQCQLIQCSRSYTTSTMIFPLIIKSWLLLRPTEKGCSPILIVSHLMMGTLDLCPGIHLWSVFVSDGIRRVVE